jgi:DNA-binding protein HU-beta
MANANKIHKDQLLERIARRANLPRKETEDVIDSFEKEVIAIMKDGKEAVLTGFGSFVARTREARMGVNPQKPSERIKIPTVTVPKFKAGKTLKDALKNESEPSASKESSDAAPPTENEFSSSASE